MQVKMEELLTRLKDEKFAKFERSVQCMFELKALSKWDRAYIKKWYTGGVTIEEVEKAEKAARAANARKPIRYAAAVIENMKTAGRAESSSSFDIKDFWERAVKKSYGGKDDGKG